MADVSDRTPPELPTAEPDAEALRTAKVAMSEAIRAVIAAPSQLGPAEQLRDATAAVLTLDPRAAHGVVNGARELLQSGRVIRAVVTAISTAATHDMDASPLDPEQRIAFLEMGVELLEKPTIVSGVHDDEARASVLDQTAAAYDFAAGRVRDELKVDVFRAKAEHRRSTATVLRAEAALHGAVRAASRNAGLGR